MKAIYVLFALLLLVDGSFKAQENKRNICYLKINVDNTTPNDNLKVYFGLSSNPNDLFWSYILYGEKSDFSCRLESNGTRIIKVMKIEDSFDNTNLKKLRHSDTVFFLIKTNYFYKGIRDFFIFKPGDTVEKYFNKFELPPDSLIDYFYK